MLNQAKGEEQLKQPLFIVVNKKNQDLPMEASDQFNVGFFYRILFLGKSRDSRQERRNWCKRKIGKTLTISKGLPD